MKTCGYRVERDGAKQPCGAKATHLVKGTGKYGTGRETHVCRVHVYTAMNEWHFQSVEPVTNE